MYKIMVNKYYIFVANNTEEESLATNKGLWFYDSESTQQELHDTIKRIKQDDVIVGYVRELLEFDQIMVLPDNSLSRKGVQQR